MKRSKLSERYKKYGTKAKYGCLNDLELEQLTEAQCKALNNYDRDVSRSNVRDYELKQLIKQSGVKQPAIYGTRDSMSPADTMRMLKLYITDRPNRYIAWLYLSGYTQVEIAGKLRVSRQTIATRLRTIKAELKAVQEHGRGDGEEKWGTGIDIYGTLLSAGFTPTGDTNNGQ